MTSSAQSNTNTPSEQRATREISFRSVDVSYGRKRKQPTIKSAADVALWFRSVVPNNSQEHVIALYLGGAHEPIGFSVVATGTANMCVVHPREVFQRAVLLGACKIILAHNHPSDNLEPSTEDQKVTAQIKDAGEVLGIKLLDHVIFTDDGYYSFQEMGNL